MMENKMKIEIWSDVICPFCYIGKREFEKALAQFPEKDQFDIEWKSYQLAPDMVTNPKKSIDEYLADAKGISIDDAHSMNASVTERAKEAGLDYHFEKAIPANTMKAHIFSHFAKKHGKQDAAEEALFRAYFTEGKNIDDIPTLVSLGEKLQLDTDELKTIFENDTYSEAVRADIYEAFQLGVRGVPFFVFDRKYAISGAQPHTAFIQTIQKSFSEWEKSQPAALQLHEGETCSADGDCA